jgi:hypothetical protein
MILSNADELMQYYKILNPVFISIEVNDKDKEEDQG